MAPGTDGLAALAGPVGRPGTERVPGVDHGGVLPLVPVGVQEPAARRADRRSVGHELRHRDHVSRHAGELHDRGAGRRLIDRRASRRLRRTHRRESGAGTRAGTDHGSDGGRHPARRAHPPFGRGPGPAVRRHGRPRQRQDPRRRRRSGRVVAGPAGSRGAPASGRRIRTHGRRTPRDRDPGRHLSRAVHPAAIGVLADLGRRHLSDLSRLRMPPPAASDPGRPVAADGSRDAPRRPRGDVRLGGACVGRSTVDLG